MAQIEQISARKILDSRDQWTIEVSTILSDGSVGEASVPQGKSKGSNEAVYVTPERSIENIKKIIFPKIKGLSAYNQESIDETLIALDGVENKSNLGANAILGVSLSICRASSISKKVELFEYLKETFSFKNNKTPPRFLVNVINGGLHAGNNLDFQEYIIIPKTETIKQSAAISQRFYQILSEIIEKRFGEEGINVGDEGGFAPNFKDNIEPFFLLKEIADKYFSNLIDFGLDAAASNISKTPDELNAIYNAIKENVGLWYLEDPFSENDMENFSKIKNRFSPETIIVGDDLTTTNVERIEEAEKRKAISGIIIKPNQIGTITETIRAIKKAEEFGYKIFISHRSGETNDDFIADLAYATNAAGIKLGSPARGERVAKYNRLLAIEGTQLENKSR